MALTKRFGNFQPYARITDRANGRMGGLEAGFVTYTQREVEGESAETYHVSSFEMAGRTDHLAAPVYSLFGLDEELANTALPLEGDADLMREPAEVAEKVPAKSKVTPLVVADTSDTTEVTA